MVRVQSGDRDAFDDLYGLTSASAHVTALRTTWSVEHAAEVVQEVYLYAWQQASAYDPTKASVLSWLLMLTHRRAVDRVRAVTSAVQRDQGDFHRTDVATADIADVVVAQDEASGVRGAVRRLPQKQREAVTLTYLHGYTTQEAACAARRPRRDGQDARTDRDRLAAAPPQRARPLNRGAGARTWAQPSGSPASTVGAAGRARTGSCDGRWRRWFSATTPVHSIVHARVPA